MTTHPGTTSRLHRHVQNSVGSDMSPRLGGHVEAPVYSGRVTPAKWFIRGWQHRLEPLLCLNDVSIRRVDDAWESMLCQFLEASGPRTIRWDLRSGVTLTPSDSSEIVEYLRERGLLEQFLEGWADEEEDLDSIAIAPLLEVPSHYTTASTVVMIANTLGDEGWGRIFSRLRVFVWDPLVEEQIADMRTWNPPVPGAILGVIESCHRAGEVIRLDYRSIDHAADALRLGMSWEDSLRSSFYAPDDQQVLEDSVDVLHWLARKKVTVFTERDLYQEVACLRGDRNKSRRRAVLDYLIAAGWIDRDLPPAVVRPGQRGRRPSATYRVVR